jgi:uncharacterized protein
MDRRGIVRAALAALAAAAATGARAAPERAEKVVYHLADADKSVFVLGNIKNHLAGASGPLTLALVVHGGALSSFRATTHDQAVRDGADEALKAGVALYACAHTMAAQKMTLKDLLPGFAVAEKGGVVLLADLQTQGWAYLRP